MRLEIEKIIPVAEGLSKLFYPFVEIVVHDLLKDQIEAIYNSFSKRKVGDRSYLDNADLSVNTNNGVIGPYEKINYDGRRLKSISMILRSNTEIGRAHV